MRLGSSASIGIAMLLGIIVFCWNSKAQHSERRWQDARVLAKLGERLFFDKALSTRNNTSCATCHVPEHSFTDQRRFSLGQSGDQMTRNTPSLLNRPSIGFQFWDGRALSLAEQVFHPLENPDEMGISMDDVCSRLGEINGYQEMFSSAFGTADITPERLTDAIAAYVQTLGKYESDYDRGKKAGSLSAEVRRGEKLFFGTARCALCHTGQSFTDERFHNTGVAWASKQVDAGRGALTGRSRDMRAFKTPTLRELTRTAPYMHDGSIIKLEQVIDFYVKGGVPSDPSIDPILKPIKLTPTEVKALTAFLVSLSDSRRPPFQTPEIYK